MFVGARGPSDGTSRPGTVLDLARPQVGTRRGRDKFQTLGTRTGRGEDETRTKPTTFSDDV